MKTYSTFFKMSYSIFCSTKMPALAIASFLFILDGILSKFAMVPDEYMLLSLGKKRCTLLLMGDLYTPGSTLIKKI